MRTIAVANQKGGCGKTTTSVNLAASLGELGHRVLLVDMDPQGHASLLLGLDPDLVAETIHDVLSDSGKSLRAVIRTCADGIDLAPSNVFLSSVEQELQGKPRREFRLSDALATAAASYSYAIVDCPPALGFLTINSLVAADEVLVPVDASLPSLHGLGRLLDTVELVERNTARKLPVRPLSTMYDDRTRFARQMRQRLEESFGEEIFTTRIHASVVARQAAAQGKPIGKAFPGSRLHEEHLGVARELLARAPAGLFRAPDGPLGPVVRGGEVAFRFVAPARAEVALAGDFNGWDPARGAMRFDEVTGTWVLRLRLEPGSYQYRFVVNGDWLEDPANEVKAYGREGFRNSLVLVGGAGS
ncbi:MAG: AAA family ATPase [Deltaproteobacteria bacterium]|nr:AAA family ATPase [Deltaproteobacteria bacterium]